MNAEAQQVSWPIVPGRIEIAEKCVQIAEDVTRVEQMAARFKVIDNDELAAEALDFMDAVRQAEKKVEARRAQYVAGPNEFVKTVNSIVKGYATRLTSARTGVAKRALAYQDEKNAQAQRLAEETRKRQEEDALRRAEAMEKAGNKAGASQLLDIATTAPAPKQEVRLRTESGIATQVNEYWSGEIVDMRAFLSALLVGQFAEHVTLEHISVQKTALNNFAKANKEKLSKVVCGVMIDSRRDLSTR